MSSNINGESKLIMHAENKLYKIFGVIGFINIPFVVLIYIYRHFVFYEGLMMAGVFWIVFFSIIYWYRIIITDDSIEYRDLLLGSSRRQYTDFEAARVTVGNQGIFSPIFRPYICLELHPNAKSNTKPMYINVRVFREEEVHKLYDILEMNGIRFYQSHRNVRSKGGEST